MAFTEATTAAEVIDGTDLSGRTAVITGATSGIGLETARAFASAGATVVLGNRDADKAEAAADDICASVAGAEVELGLLDLTSLASVREFAAWVNANHSRIDILVNNAGVMATPFSRTAEGFELQFGTNHLAPFLLTKLLLPSLLVSGSARVVNVTSNAHHFGGINWDDPGYDTTPYTPGGGYSQSKTANLLFAAELDRRVGIRGVHAYSVHPGAVDTTLFRYMDDNSQTQMKQWFVHNKVYLKTPPQGAATTVWAATSPDLADHGGAYLQDCHVSDEVAAHAQDPADGARLWALSEELIGEKFPT